MRSTGEVMASASDLPTAFAKAERAAGRPLPTSGTAFLSVRDADKPDVVPVAAALAGLGFKLVATEGTARALHAAGLDAERVAKVAEGGEATVVDLVRRGRCDLVINTPFGGSRQRTDGYRIREAALAARVPCITTISGAAAAVHAIANARRELALSLQERIEENGEAGSVAGGPLRPGQRRSEEHAVSPRASSCRSPHARPSGRTPSSGSSADRSTLDIPGSSSCWRRPGVCCRGR